MKQLEFSYIAPWTMNYRQECEFSYTTPARSENHLELFSNIKNVHNLWPVNFTPRYILYRNSWANIAENRYISEYNNIITTPK